MYKYQELNPGLGLNKQAEFEKKLLRLSDEPCVYIGEYQIHKIMLEHTKEFMQLILQFYKNWGENSNLVNMPKKQVFYADGLEGDFRVMSCAINSEEHVKSVKVIGTNEENKTLVDKICVGKSLLIDKDDNFIYAILDVCALSSYRTAAISVLAFSFLNNIKNAKVGLIGLGRIGFYNAYILYSWLGVKKFLCYDKDKNSLKRFSQLINIYLPEASLKMVNDKKVISESNSLFISTDSENPILYKNNTEHMSFISSVGADANNLSELDDSILLNDHQLVTDSLHSLLLGDMRTWMDKGIISSTDVVELKDIINGNKDVNNKVIFISTGIAVQDALISKFITNKILGVNN